MGQDEAPDDALENSPDKSKDPSKPPMGQDNAPDDLPDGSPDNSPDKSEDQSNPNSAGDVTICSITIECSRIGDRSISDMAMTEDDDTADKGETLDKMICVNV